jgi:hypothetical protein
MAAAMMRLTVIGERRGRGAVEQGANIIAVFEVVPLSLSGSLSKSVFFDPDSDFDSD